MWNHRPAPSRVRGLLLALALVAPACGPSTPEVAAEGWVGAYTGPEGVRLTLEESEPGRLSGTLVIDSEGAANRFPVRFRAVAPSRIEGDFESAGKTFALTVSTTDGGRIVVESEGNRHELEREGTAANPLARAGGRESPPGKSTSLPPEARAKPGTPAPAVGASPVTTAPVEGANYRHPEGWYSLKVPTAWQATMSSPSVVEFDTGVDEEGVLVVIGTLEEHEIGPPLTAILPGITAALDGFLAQGGIVASGPASETLATTVGALPGAISRRRASAGGESYSVWQGTVVQGGHAFLLVGLAPQARADGLAATLAATFATLRVHGEPSTGAPASSGERQVAFNGTRLDSDALRRLEGSVPVIPDGEYWYDRRSGMVGRIGGPTLAYLAPQLDLGGPLAADASGRGTAVSVNGRFLHPQDLAGLEVYFGPIRPGRYWFDAQGNYGAEGGPAQGNLVQEIAALQRLMAAGGGQGGPGHAGAGGSGGSVYSHFPNLGASGTGVGVADLGGGDTIVNAGGVMWWPGK